VRARQLYFGAYAKKASGAHIRPFVCLAAEEVPERCLEVQCEVLPREEADQKAQEIAKRHKEEREKQKVVEPIKTEEATSSTWEVPDLHPGRVAVHDDGVKSHIAIIVEVGEEYTKALFFTSNPSWGKAQARRARTEELAYTGFVSTRKTYLMGVVRPTSEFSPMDAVVPDVSKYVKDFDFAERRAG
jgi:hypothetical protein